MYIHDTYIYIYIDIYTQPFAQPFAQSLSHKAFRTKAFAELSAAHGRHEQHKLERRLASKRQTMVKKRGLKSIKIYLTLIKN